MEWPARLRVSYGEVYIVHKRYILVSTFSLLNLRGVERWMLEDPLGLRVP